MIQLHLMPKELSNPDRFPDDVAPLCLLFGYISKCEASTAGLDYGPVLSSVGDVSALSNTWCAITKNYCTISSEMLLKLYVPKVFLLWYLLLTMNI